MTTSTKVKDDGFAGACEDSGVEANASHPPFIPFKDKVGSWFTGTLLSSRDVTYTPKKGKNKGKKQETTYFLVKVEKTNIEGVDAGEQYTISPSGLLNYQLTEGKPKGLEFPCHVGVKYEGTDDEGRHQTRVAWPTKA